MFDPEYRVGFQVLREEIGLGSALKVVVPAVLKSLMTRYGATENAEEPEKTKASIKNHFKLLAWMYKNLQSRYGVARTNQVMQQILMTAGQIFFQGFEPLGPDDDLTRFVQIYKDFERQNTVFDVIGESKERFEIVIRRCLIYEAFTELGLADLTQWMCDIAFAYFSHYDPRMRYWKDRMIARGDNTCHEVFVWKPETEGRPRSAV